MSGANRTKTSVGGRGAKSTQSPWKLIGVAGVVLAVVIGVVYVAGSWFGPKVDAVIADRLEHYPEPSEVELARVHVPIGTRIEYATDPPVWGPHYPSVLPAGRVYDQSGWMIELNSFEPGLGQRALIDPSLLLGFLVHNLEHGHIVAYYDPRELSDEDMAKLHDLIARNQGRRNSFGAVYGAVLAVPRTDPEHPLILTAWEYILRLDHYEDEAVEAFVEAFRQTRHL